MLPASYFLRVSPLLVRLLTYDDLACWDRLLAFGGISGAGSPETAGLANGLFPAFRTAVFDTTQHP
jgi:hypothetical protein